MPTHRIFLNRAQKLWPEKLLGKQGALQELW